jgi:hypothetical protein
MANMLSSNGRPTLRLVEGRIRQRGTPMQRVRPRWNISSSQEVEVVPEAHLVVVAVQGVCGLPPDLPFLGPSMSKSALAVPVVSVTLLEIRVQNRRLERLNLLVAVMGVGIIPILLMIGYST